MRNVVWSLVCLLMIQPVLAADEPGRMTVTGVGVAEAVPDMATISLGVTSEARTAAAALNANNGDTAEVLAFVEAAGIAPRDVQTSGLSLSPVWNNRSNSSVKPAIVGYVARNQITIRVRDLDTLGSVLDGSVGEGATEFNGLSFGIQDPQPLADAARVDAVKDARRKARLLAAAAGISLGPILDLSSSGRAAPQPMAMREMAMADSVPVAAGEVAVQEIVTIVWEIVQ